MTLVLALEEINLSLAPEVGLKAATLSELCRMHLPTPPGVCFTTQAYRLILEPLEERILARATYSAVLDPIEIEDVAVEAAGHSPPGRRRRVQVLVDSQYQCLR